MEFENREWLLIKTFELETTIIDDDQEEEGTLYYHLLENVEGQRKLHITYTFDINVGNVPYTTRLYNEKIIRWIYGRPDPDIPKYKEIAMEDTANFLRGRIK